MAYLKVRVSPGARSDTVVGWMEDVLRIRVKAPPERGKANDAVLRFIASTLGLPAAQVTLRRGGSSRNKLLYVDSMTDDEVRKRLNV
ncbi:MAG: DUF167 domain-containing protein [Chloroflexi bacterium]|nr:DUF167 domain-containing protein [Chloroflexota bacterium]